MERNRKDERTRGGRWFQRNRFCTDRIGYLYMCILSTDNMHKICKILSWTNFKNIGGSQDIQLLAEELLNRRFLRYKNSKVERVTIYVDACVVGTYYHAKLTLWQFYFKKYMKIGENCYGGIKRNRLERGKCSYLSKTHMHLYTTQIFE